MTLDVSKGAKPFGAPSSEGTDPAFSSKNSGKGTMSISSPNVSANSSPQPGHTVSMRVTPAARIWPSNLSRSPAARSNSPALMRGLPQQSSDSAQATPARVSHAPTLRVRSGA